MSENQELFNRVVNEIEKGEKYPLNQQLKSLGIEAVYRSMYNGRVEFKCNGIFQNRYHGFYYVPDDLPADLLGGYDTLRKDGDGWKWDTAYASYYTERILENWYYFIRVSF